MVDVKDNIHNPDVLSCLSNLSSDEVFTPPVLANEILDMLPQELFKDPNVTFLDPACKTGVFLREIAKRLIVGLEKAIPDLQTRIDHILHMQLFGIAITQLTALISRRSLYCSKSANGPYSITKFENEDGNIYFKRINHSWNRDGKCTYCGASQKMYDRPIDLESHAYAFIHTDNLETIFNMRFDVIVSNPPYQLNTGGGSAQATPLYDKFVEQCKKLNPRYMSIIMPSRWYAGGIGLDQFRSTMLNDTHIKRFVDFANAKDCFPQNSIGGGVCYFLWDREYNGACTFTNRIGKEDSTLVRNLSEFPVLVRYNKAVSILRKIISQKENSISDWVGPISPFALPTKIRGTKYPTPSNTITLFASSGISYINENLVQKGLQYLDSYKVMISQTGAEHAGEPSKDNKYRVLTSTMRVLNPKEVCTHSYLVIGPFEDEVTSNNVAKYLKTSFARFLILLAMTSIHLTKQTFIFVPQQDFSQEWTDIDLYNKYGLSKEEVAFIDSLIKPFSSEEGE